MSEQHTVGTQVMIGPSRDVAAEIVSIRRTEEGWIEYEVAWMDNGRHRQTARLYASLFDVVGGSTEHGAENYFTQEIANR